MQPPGGEAFLSGQILHYLAARERVVHVQFVDPAHEDEIVRADCVTFMPIPGLCRYRFASI